MNKEWTDETVPTKSAIIAHFANLCGQSGFTIISNGTRYTQNWNVLRLHCNRGITSKPKKVSSIIVSNSYSSIVSNFSHSIT
jgi:hypothetical protein